MKRIILLILLLTPALLLVNACTTFFINANGELLFGRNYDWITDAGMVCTNQKGLAKTSMKTSDGETINWVSVYGSITFNQYGKEFPTGGTNEKGLVVELMWLDETKYPSPDSRPAVGVLQWIQYQLDNCTTINEVIATDKKLRIASAGTPPLHYLIADAGGNAATIEFLNGTMVVHKGNDLSQPVLTNNSYNESIKSYHSSRPAADNSLQRFAQACKMIHEIDGGNVTKPLNDYAFDILGAVAQGNATKWSIVYDITNKTIQFRTQRFRQIKTVSFSAFNFNCSSPSKVWDINQPGGGDISNLFVDFLFSINKKIIETAANESNERVPITEAARTAQWNYPDGIKCK